MNLIKSFINKQNEIKQEKNLMCDCLIEEINTILTLIDNLFENKNEFVNPLDVQKTIEENSLFKNKLEYKESKKLKGSSNYKALLNIKDKYNSLVNDLEININQHNDKVAKTKVEEAYSLIGDVEGRRLDEQQMTCIVKDVANHLVVAGAGTGKTTTIVGKIKYLLAKGIADYKGILVLSFTNVSAAEMNERIKKETTKDIEAITFHKLGLNILTKVEGKVPNISHLDVRKFVKKELEENIKNDEYLKVLTKHLLHSRVKEKNEFEFENRFEYEEWKEINKPITLKNEVVKSYGEMKIANYLFVNGIEYEYEKTYCIDTRDENHSQYYPDFYLPEYDIYIEYFGIDRNYNVPKWFNDNGEYVNGIKWKRNLHKSNNTTLIECYAYEHLEDILIEKLKTRLTEASVKFNPLTPLEMYEILYKENEGILTGLISLFITLINLIKSNNYTYEYVKELNKDSSNRDKNTNDDLLYLLKPIYDGYNNQLAKDNTIDFNDMINKASEYIKAGKYQHSYKYVIVDEYQDISKSRFNLLWNLRESKFYNLFCVGDDWQSIYRFSGSDIDYITNFSKYWGYSQISRIETTYRFNNSLIEISGKFIMKNPYQIKKTLVSKMYGDSFALGNINGYTTKTQINNLTKRLDDLPNNSSVYFIGRYNFDVHMFDGNELFRFRYDNVNGVVIVIYKNRPDLKINYLTAHSSKGLQADYVFILNNKNSIMGFPSKIEDSSLVEMLLEGKDDYPFAEERRLFYVALTRARIKTFILTNKNISIFAKELLLEYESELKKEYFTCPLCGGRLLKREGKYGVFYGCSNFKESGCKYVRKQ